MSAAHDGIPGAAGATVAQARFASALAFDHLPAEVVERTKTCVLDTLGCCLFGSTQPSVRKLTTMVAGEDSGGSAILMGTARRASASMSCSGRACVVSDSAMYTGRRCRSASAALPRINTLRQSTRSSARSEVTALRTLWWSSAACCC